MLIVLLLSSILFISATFFLWYLGKAQMINLSLETSFADRSFRLSRCNTSVLIGKNNRFSKIENLKSFIDYLGARLGDKPISIQVKADERELEIEAYNQQELLEAEKRAKEFLNSIGKGSEESSQKSQYTADELSRGATYSGNAILPKRVYEGDSQIIRLNLKPDFQLNLIGENLQFQETETGKILRFKTPELNNYKQFLEVELLAPGLTVSGDIKQCCSLTSTSLSYRWNCYFQNLGNHSILLSLKLINPNERPDEAIHLGDIEQRVKVIKAFNLTKKQLWFMSSIVGISGVVSTGLTIFEGIKKILVH
jgi:hypothetical protein